MEWNNWNRFFCKIPILNKIKNILLTNNHILNEESIKLGNRIKLAYQNKIKIIEKTNERFCKTNFLFDFTYIEILDEDDIEDSIKLKL